MNCLHVAWTVLLGLSTACGGRGVTQVREPLGDGSGESGPSYFKAKCKSEIQDCFDDARNQCGGKFTLVHKESHSGGLLADALPGPVTWYTVSFRCGAPAESLLAFAEQEALREFVMPTCEAGWDGRCGLLADRLEFNAAIDAPPLGVDAVAPPKKGGGTITVAINACSKRNATLTDECRSEFRVAHVQYLRKRYTRVSDERLLAWCNDHPVECDPSRPDMLRLLEQDFLQAHDRIVFTRYRQNARTASNAVQHDSEQRDSQNQGAIEEEQIRQVRGQMLQRAMDSFDTNRTKVDVTIRTEK